ncbi:DUF1801 domain-containing protein [Aggregatimonas sangjinii]|uniref:DUF1801 domain-containing protein n=1 Tax=Aggregatimonas sangjinii TaxID=2583587 RepID=A0A5B7SQ26_9FLAO|nr:DUF1801 domain-containing protein [Aggregatimonas sangjinii]QCW99092.1 DUF1801 domain-containing protein [Aggregatimonas sangjinii]
MKHLKVLTDPKVKSKFETYPTVIHTKLTALRNLIVEVATTDENISELEETLKWGEPSCLVKKGSTIRIDWKTKTPEQYAMYFKCTSKLVSTFKEVFGDTFSYEKNRAILFRLNDNVPQMELKECIGMALNYHTLKNLPLLGSSPKIGR